jgi:hypothetical protein
MSITVMQNTWNNPETTPSIIQTGFGAYGPDLPGDGLEYCGPTTVAMGLYWLAGNGFTQLASKNYNADDPNDVAAAQNLVTVLGGPVGHIWVSAFTSAINLGSNTADANTAGYQ